MAKRGMTVGELRAALVGVDDALEVTIRDVMGDEPTGFCGSLISATVEPTCDEDVPHHFAIDATNDEDLLDELADTE